MAVEEISGTTAQGHQAMKDYTRREIGLAAALSGAAGFVDAVGYMQLGGFFVSFMSGNSTRLGVGLGAGALDQAGRAGGLILLFFTGVIAGAVIARAGGNRRAPVMAAVTAVLLASAALFSLGRGEAGVVGLALAMGAVNSVFQRDGEVAVGLTYMTGALVKAGHRLAAALNGGDPLAWLPYALLWAALTAGAIIGAGLFLQVGASAIWAAALLLLLLTARTAWVERR